MFLEEERLYINREQQGGPVEVNLCGSTCRDRRAGNCHWDP